MSFQVSPSFLRRGFSLPHPLPSDSDKPFEMEWCGDSREDLVFSELRTLGYLDERGTLLPSIDQTPPFISFATLRMIKQFFQRPLEGMGMTLFEFCQRDLQLTIARHEPSFPIYIIGSAVPHLLQEMLPDWLCAVLGNKVKRLLVDDKVIWNNIIAEPSDWDLRHGRSSISKMDMGLFLSRLSGRKTSIMVESFIEGEASAPFTPCVSCFSRDRNFLDYTTVTMGNVDYTFMGAMLGKPTGRGYLFEESNCQIRIEPSAFLSDQWNVTIVSENNRALQAIINRATRRLQVTNVHTVDYRGLARLLSAQLKGYSEVTRGIYLTLLDTFLYKCNPNRFSDDPKKWAKQVICLFQNVVTHHHAGSLKALSFLLLCFEKAMPKERISMRGSDDSWLSQEKLLELLWC